MVDTLKQLRDWVPLGLGVIGMSVNGLPLTSSYSVRLFTKILLMVLIWLALFRIFQLGSLTAYAVKQSLKSFIRPKNSPNTKTATALRDYNNQVNTPKDPPPKLVKMFLLVPGIMLSLIYIPLVGIDVDMPRFFDDVNSKPACEGFPTFPDNTVVIALTDFGQVRKTFIEDRLYEALLDFKANEALSHVDVGICRIHYSMSNKDEAQHLGERIPASIVIWGRIDDIYEVNFSVIGSTTANVTVETSTHDDDRYTFQMRAAPDLEILTKIAVSRALTLQFANRYNRAYKNYIEDDPKKDLTPFFHDPATRAITEIVRHSTDILRETLPRTKAGFEEMVNSGIISDRTLRDAYNDMGNQYVFLSGLDKIYPHELPAFNAESLWTFEFLVNEFKGDIYPLDAAFFVAQEYSSIGRDIDAIPIYQQYIDGETAQSSDACPGLVSDAYEQLILSQISASYDLKNIQSTIQKGAACLDEDQKSNLRDTFDEIISAATDAERNEIIEIERLLQ
ncbi:MAG: hypothetical protein GC179_30170 [Anaerolineaceae bacterium]|nr:hypothetical protein [Anaerolineaceae bacterium]